MHKLTVTMTFDTKTAEQAEYLRKFFFDAQALMTCENSTFEASVRDEEIDSKVFVMREDGFHNYHHIVLQPGVRVRNASQQYTAAIEQGTATVICVMRKEGEWEEKYGRMNLEVLVRMDDGRLTWWADYLTVLARNSKV